MIPRYIKESMHMVASHAALCELHMRRVEEWLEKHGLDIENQLRDGSGCSLDELEFGNDIVDELCERIKNLLEGE